MLGRYFSLRVKFFALAIAIAAITALVSNWRNIFTFQAILEQYVRASALDVTEDLGDKLSSRLKIWDNVAKTLIADVGSKPSRDPPQSFDKLVSKEQSLLQIGSFVFSQNNASKNFQLIAGNLPKAISLEINEEIELKIKSFEKLPDFDPKGQVLGIKALKTAFVVLKRKVFDNGTTVWVYLLIKDEILTDELNLNSKIRSYLVSATSLDTLLGSTPDPDVSRLLGNRRSARLLKTDVGAGILAGEDQPKKDKWFVSYARIEAFNLLLLIRFSEEAITSPISESVWNALLWVCLSVLFMMLISYAAIDVVVKRINKVIASIEKIALGEFDMRLPVTSQDEVGRLNQSINYMAENLKTLVIKEREGASLAKELDIAKSVQTTFLPKPILSSYFKSEGRLIPATHCSGDWWWQEEIEPGRLLVIIGDVTGHGVASALVASIAYAVCLSVIGSEYPASHITPAHLLDRFNVLIHKALGGQLCMTCFACIIDARAKTLTYSNAGQTFPILIPHTDEISEGLRSPDGSQRRQRNYKHIRQVNKNSGILGMNSDSTYSNDVLNINSKDKIVFYTDGIFECVNTKGKAFGSKKFETQISNSSRFDPLTLCEALLQESAKFCEGQSYDDDVTLIVVEVA